MLANSTVMERVIDRIIVIVDWRRALTPFASGASARLSPAPDHHQTCDS